MVQMVMVHSHIDNSVKMLKVNNDLSPEIVTD